MLQQAFKLSLADAVALVDDPDGSVLQAYMHFQIERERKAIMDRQRSSSQAFLRNQ